MSNYYFITVEGRPPAKSNMYGTRVIKGKTESWKHARAVIYTKKELEEYELAVGKAVEQVIPETLTELQSLYLRVYQRGARSIDVDNCFKAILDGTDNSKTIKRGKNEIQVCKTGVANDKLYQLVVGERIVVDLNSEEKERVEIIIAPYNGLRELEEIVRSIYGEKGEY